MIYSKKDYESNEMDFNLDLEQIAKRIEKIIKRDDTIPYTGYTLNRKTHIICFYVKTGDGQEFVAFDSITMSYHIQNDVWISEFDETAIFKLLGLFSTIRREDMFRQFEGMQRNYE